MVGRVQFYYAGLIILLALILGGGTVQGLWTDRVIQIALIPAMFYGFVRLDESRWSLAAKGVALASLAVVAWQFLPVGRPWPEAAEAVAHGQLLTMAAGRSLEAAIFFASVAGFALFLSRFSDQSQERLLRFVIAGLLINLGVGAFQLSVASGGAAAPATVLPYGLNAGLFVNKNHFSTLVLSSIPILAYFYLYRTDRPFLFAALLGILMIYLFAVGSRAGMGLSLCAAAICMLLFWKPLRKRRSLRLILGALIAGTIVLVAVQPQLFALGDTARSTIFSTTWRAFLDHWVLGTGIGSFENVYATYEEQALIRREYINHAHNDYMEVLLETGVASIGLIAAFAALVAYGARRTTMATAFAVSILAIAAHSLVDYPLRTMAIAVLFALLSAHVLAVPISAPNDRARVRRSGSEPLG